MACEAIAISRFEPLLPLLSADELKQTADHLDRISRKRVPYRDIIIEESYAMTAQMQEEFKKLHLSRSGLSEAQSLFGVDYSDSRIPMSERMHNAAKLAKFLTQSKRMI